MEWRNVPYAGVLVHGKVIHLDRHI